MGRLLDSLYGRLDPTPADRLHALEDEEVIKVGPDRILVAVDSPGHAKHHVDLHDSLSGVLFAGDAVGVKLPDGGVLRPATPPPDFDLDQALSSLAKFARRRPSGIALAHYGLLEQPEELLAEADETLRQWAETAEQAYREGTDIAAALSARFDPLLGDIDAANKEKLDIMNGVHSNAAGSGAGSKGATPRRRPGGHARVTAESDDQFGAQFLLAYLEVIERDPALGQVLVQCGELLEQMRLVHLVGRRAVRPHRPRPPCPPCARCGRPSSPWPDPSWPGRAAVFRMSNVRVPRFTPFRPLGSGQVLTRQGNALPLFSPHSPMRRAPADPSGGGGI